MNRLPFPRPNSGRLLTTFVVAFGFLATGVAIILWAIDGPKLWIAILVLLGVVAVSAFAAVVPYAYDVISVAGNRVRQYPAVLELAEMDAARLRRATAYVRAMNSDLRIQGITERDGTVNLIFPFGTNSGITIESIVQVVEESTGESLGTVRVVESHGTVCYARPIDRRSPDFWEHLEDRMKKDFAPPTGVVGRTYQVSLVAMSELQSLLEE